MTYNSDTALYIAILYFIYKLLPVVLFFILIFLAFTKGWLKSFFDYFVSINKMPPLPTVPSKDLPDGWRIEEDR